jgi:hypothetical protein
VDLTALPDGPLEESTEQERQQVAERIETAARRFSSLISATAALIRLRLSIMLTMGTMRSNSSAFGQIARDLRSPLFIVLEKPHRRSTTVAGGKRRLGSVDRRSGFLGSREREVAGTHRACSPKGRAKMRGSEPPLVDL